MSFYSNLRLPVDVERGVEGGQGFDTRISRLPAGRQQRFPLRTEPIGEWDAGYGIQKLEDLREVIRLHVAMRGSNDGFVFRDWADYHAPFEFEEDAAAWESLGFGNGSQVIFPLTKSYEPTDYITELPSSVINTRRIYNPVLTTLVVRWNTTVKATPGDYTVDAFGNLDFTPGGAPTGGDEVNHHCQFLNPVHFMNDRLPINVRTWEAGSAPEILIESLVRQ